MAIVVAVALFVVLCRHRGVWVDAEYFLLMGTRIVWRAGTFPPEFRDARGSGQAQTARYFCVEAWRLGDVLNYQQPCANR